MNLNINLRKMGLMGEIGHNVIVMVSTVLLVLLVIVVIIFLFGYWILPKINIGEIYLVDFIK